jgi:hypothetical protein
MMANLPQIGEVRLAIQAALALLLMLSLMGCSKLSMQNYNKIAVGMSYEEVVKLIGEPTQCDDVMGIRNCEWGDEQHSAHVGFVDNKVMLFASQNLK